MPKLGIGLVLGVSLLSGCDSAEPVSMPPVEETRVTDLVPFSEGAEPAAGLRVIDEVSARCEPSVLSPENQLARRCFTSETSVVLDPCFVPADPVDVPALEKPGEEPREVDTVALCFDDPAQTELTKVHVVTDNGVWPREPAPFDPHWFLELGDGTRCTKVFGVEEIRENLPLSYDCDDGTLYGSPDEEKPVWTVHHLAEGAETLRVAEVRTAWK
ncbi:hypothetical protein [Saccharomonospora sp.]|uniref:hypothetical protein n=1 Tax=Saccharomonospora sp. TaxID=33913 RepID=UPI00260926ED|nr:hypothetical protein [Saccharomonospora sp.]